MHIIIHGIHYLGMIISHYGHKFIVHTAISSQNLLVGILQQKIIVQYIRKPRRGLLLVCGLDINHFTNHHKTYEVRTLIIYR